MTEFWKSNPMHWCDICKCWMNDSKAARAHHERGTRHVENLARKLRDMDRKASQEKRTEEHIATSIAKVEAAARKQFESDKADAELVQGHWQWIPTSSYYYNALHRHYYDPKVESYYGGDPPVWSKEPPIPFVAKFGSAPHNGGPVPQPGEAPRSVDPVILGGKGTKAPVTTKVVSRVLDVAPHPLSHIGGHQAPLTGKVGAAKGVGHITQGANDTKRKREGGGKAVSKEEEEALARREAARQRVAQRTAAGFGYA